MDITRDEALCDDGKVRTIHGVAGSQYVYANGRRVYGSVLWNADQNLFHASSTSKYRHLVSPALVGASAY